MNRIRLYLFGSAVHCKDPRDVDILLVYPDGVPPETAIRTRSRLVSRLKKILARPIHSVLLSETEVRETAFIEREMCRPLTRNHISHLRRSL
jgi:predicted nucleotidyltransferase